MNFSKMFDEHMYDRLSKVLYAKDYVMFDKHICT